MRIPAYLVSDKSDKYLTSQQNKFCFSTEIPMKTNGRASKLTENNCKLLYEVEPTY